MTSQSVMQSLGCVTSQRNVCEAGYSLRDSTTNQPNLKSFDLLQGNFEAALKDLAAAVHYDPQNAVAFFHRGCLLRK